MSTPPATGAMRPLEMVSSRYIQDDPDFHKYFEYVDAIVRKLILDSYMVDHGYTDKIE